MSAVDQRPDTAGDTTAVEECARLPLKAPGASMKSRRTVVAMVLAAVPASALIAVHRDVIGQPRSSPTALAPVDALFSLLFVGGMLILAWATGLRLLRLLPIRWYGRLERAIFAVVVGLAVFGTGTFALALARLLYPGVVIALGAASLILLRRELRDVAGDLGAAARATGCFARQSKGTAPAVAALALLILLFALPTALAPPFAYDALLYHLAVPKILIEQHRFVFLPAIAQANFPFTIEMLYTICLVFGSEAGAALVHLAFGVLTVLAVWSFAVRWLNVRASWLAMAACISASELTFWAPLPDVDLALTCCTFLSIYAAFAWLDDRRPVQLVPAALMAGVALGIKYTAGATLLVLVLMVATADGWQPKRIRQKLLSAAGVAALALLVAAPWYLKNLLVFHDPVYPLLAPPWLDHVLQAAIPPSTAPASGSVWSLLQAPWRLITTGRDESITGRSLFDYFQLPAQVYLHGDLEVYGRPSLLFLAVPFCFAIWRRPVVPRLAIIAAGLSVTWALGAQELRYLLPVFPLYALLSGAVLDGLLTAAAKVAWRRAVARGAVVIVLLLALGENALFLAARNPLPVDLGRQSRDAFLTRYVDVYGAYQYLKSVVTPGQRTLTLVEDRGYYATVPVLQDSWRVLGQVIFVDSGSAARSASLLQQEHVAYVLVNEQRIRNTTVRGVFQTFRQRYLIPVYQHGSVWVYRFTDGA